MLGDLRKRADRDVEDFFLTDVERIVRELIEVELHYVPTIQSSDSASEVAGFIDRSDARIVISQQFSETSRRFTIAHEIGHWVLHPGVKHHRDRPMASSARDRNRRPQVEIEADVFAVELLMPEFAVKRRFRKRFGVAQLWRNEITEGVRAQLSLMAGREYDVSQLKGTTRSASLAISTIRSSSSRIDDSLVAVFDVSPTAMAIRLEDLGLVS